ncbi:4-hydroxy-tetrahydrodipicolinate synthase [Paenibacillaceae bacterium]|nr:4-hydroxy-tetrahydrodipicolinate synthase [Paenibacillaceae bacterium]
MLTTCDVKGIYVPVITPFCPNEEIDWGSYENYINTLTAQDIQGLVINGTTGESPTVLWSEVEQLIQRTKSALNHRRVPIVVGAGTNSTASTVKQIEMAGQSGADAVLVVTPYYSLPSEAGIIEHFRRAAGVGVPLILYEIPSRTGMALSVDTIRRLMDLNGVIGLKDSTGSSKLISSLPRQDMKPVLCGDDLHFIDMLREGASGGMLASANLYTEALLNVFQLVQNGELPKAQTAFNLLTPYIQQLFQESNPAPLKFLLAQQDIIASDTLRLPMGPISQKLQLELEQVYVNNVSF